MSDFLDAWSAVQTEIHETAVSKGWWEESEEIKLVRDIYQESIGQFLQDKGDTKSSKADATIAACFDALGARNDAELIALMHSELSEALEWLRHNAQSDKIPDFLAVEEELADTVIRIMDAAEAKGWKVGEMITPGANPEISEPGFVAAWNHVACKFCSNPRDSWIWDNWIAVLHMDLSKALECLRHGDTPDGPLSNVVTLIMEISAERGWRVAEAIEAKMAMNRTRSHKHGGKIF